MGRTFPWHVMCEDQSPSSLASPCGLNYTEGEQVNVCVRELQKGSGAALQTERESKSRLRER